MKRMRIVFSAFTMLLASFGSASVLPDGYTRVDYVRIPTDVNRNNCVMLWDIKWLDVKSVSLRYRGMTAPSTCLMLMASSSNTSGTDRQNPYFAIDSLADKRAQGFKSFTWHLTPGDDYLPDGVTVHELSADCDYNASNNRVLFGGWNDMYFSGTIDWFSVVLFDGNGGLLAEMIPCVNSENVAGFYDGVSKRFFERANSGATAFSAGPAVSSFKASVAYENEALGALSPAVGTYTYAADSTPTFSLTGGEDVGGETYYYNADRTIRAKFAGCDFAYRYSAPETQSATSFSKKMAEDAALVWKFDSYARKPSALVPRVSGAGSVTVNGNSRDADVWIEDGEVTLVAIPDEGATFVGWSGSTKGVADVTQPTIKVSISGMDALEPLFRKGPMIHYVSVDTGDDSTGMGTISAPWKTINGAIANALTIDGDEIRIAGGLYQEVVVNNLRSCLTIRGGYKADWTRDLRNCPTVICQVDPGHWSSRKNAFELGMGIVSNNIDGLTITGGNDGIKVADYYGHRFDRLIITNNIQGIEFAYCNAHSVAGGDTVIASSCISHNGHTGSLGYGTADYGISISDSPALVSTFHILNCTIVSNGTYGVFTARHPLFVVNSVIADNGWSETRREPADFCYGAYNNKTTKMRHADVWNRNPRAGIVLDEKPCGANGVDLGHFKLYAPEALLNIDPCLRTDGSLASDSPLIGLGEDLSSAEIPVTTDVYGEAFRAGAYDIGCCKSSVAKSKPAASSDIYVATDGDDANGGTTPEAPLKSVGVAMTRVAENGTVHVAAGTYGESVVLDVPGVTLEGAGRDETFFRFRNATNCFGLYMGAPAVTVKNLSAENALFGVQISDQTTATNALVESCRLAGNRFGYFHFSEGKAVPGYPGLSVPVFRFSRLIVSNNVFGAGYLGNMGAPVVIDASLVAFNGGSVGPYGGPYSSSVKDHYYNCTFVSNVNYAVWSDNGGNSARDTKFYNCIFTGNPIGWKCSGHYGWGYDCIFDCVTNYFFTDSYGYWQSGKTNRLHEVTAPLDWSARKWAHPLPESLAAKGGKNYNGTGTLLYDVTGDLDGRTGSSRFWFIGCYAPPTPGLSIIVR